MQMTAFEAHYLALQGDVLAGRRYLLAEIERAQKVLDDGEAWGAELVEKYQVELHRHSILYGQPREDL